MLGGLLRVLGGLLRVLGGLVRVLGGFPGDVEGLMPEAFGGQHVGCRGALGALRGEDRQGAWHEVAEVLVGHEVTAFQVMAKGTLCAVRLEAGG